MSSAIAHLLLDQLDLDYCNDYHCGIRMHKKLLLIADCNAVASQNWFHHATATLARLCYYHELAVAGKEKEMLVAGKCMKDLA